MICDMSMFITWYSSNRTDRHDITGILFKHSEISKMLESLIDNIFVFVLVFGEHVYQQTADIPVGTNCAPFTPTSSFILMRQAA